MRLVFALFIVVLIEAKKKRPPERLGAEEDRPIRNIDLYPDHFKHPVPFGHIYKDGFGDPRSNLKQPIDIVELSMRKPKNVEEAKEIWEKRRHSVQILPVNIPRRFASPRDEYWHELQQRNATGGTQSELGNNSSRTWIDWDAIQQYNAGQPRSFFRRPQSMRRPNQQNPARNRTPKKQYFSPNSFDLVSDMRQDGLNWTTCEEFSRVPNFHPKDVMNIDWVPFFLWSPLKLHEAVVHRFSYPTKKLVKRYKDEYANHLNSSIDWEQPKLVLEEAIEMLLIAGDRTGLFYAIPKLDIPPTLKNKPIQFPTLTMRLKIEDPYLALMHCENQFAVIMAVAGNEPTTEKEKRTEAATLKFRGAGYPVERNLEAEQMRINTDREWKAQKKANEVIRINEPVVRDHFLGRDVMK